MWSYISTTGHLLYSYKVLAKVNLIKSISVFFLTMWKYQLSLNNQWCMAFELSISHFLYKINASILMNLALHYLF